MKKLYLLLLLPIIIGSCSPDSSSTGLSKKRPAPGCNNLYLDLEKGRINGVGPLASPEEVKLQLPCSTAETEEGAEYHCGGGVFYSNLSLYFYTHADFFEVRTGFSGDADLELLNRTREEIEATLGRPHKSNLHDMFYYNTKFGCISLYFFKGRVAKIGVHAIECEQVEPCR